MTYKFKTNFYLLKELTKRDIYSRYKGSIFGVLWALLTPLAMLVVFSFVFGGILQAKWGTGTSGGMAEFSLNLFIGLSIFWYFGDILSRAPSLIVSNPNYVKKVIFPLEILPIVSLLSGLFHLGIHLIIILFAIVFIYGKIPLSIFSLPIVIGVTFPMVVGFGLILSSIGVYIRDVGSVISVVVNMLMFLSPVFYPLSSIPLNLHWLFQINPLTLIIEQCRVVFIDGMMPDWFALGIYFGISLIIYFIGYKIFILTKKGFADVI